MRCVEPRGRGGVRSGQRQSPRGGGRGGAGWVVTPPPHPGAGTAASPPRQRSAGSREHRTRTPQRSGAQRRWLGGNNGSRCGNANSRSPIRTPPILPRLLPYPTAGGPLPRTHPERREPGADRDRPRSPHPSPAAPTRPPHARGADPPQHLEPTRGAGRCRGSDAVSGAGTWSQEGLLGRGGSEHSRWECRGSDAMGQRTDESDPVPVPARPRGAVRPRPARPRPVPPRAVRSVPLPPAP